MSLDLGAYKSIYSNYIKKVKKDNEDDSLIIIYSVKKKEEDAILKIINKELLQEEEDYDFLNEHIQKEIELNYLCNSDYILKLNKNFETDKYIALELEYYNSDLKEYIYNNGKLETKLVGKNNLEIFKDITIALAKAMKSIHEKGVVHRNIKPHNIFIDIENKKIKKIKLGDFSSAIYIKEINDSEPMGTILYTAPEIIKNLDYTEKCDMWSVGLTLFEIYFGVLPYGEDVNTKIMNDMIYNEKKFVYRKSNIATLDILFRRLLQINPDNRMDASEFYDYVTNNDFLKPNAIAINNNIKYLNLHKEILSLPQIEYKEKTQLESLKKGEKEKQNIQKILGFVENGNLPDIMNFANGVINKEEKFNNIIYYDNNAQKYEKDIFVDSDIFEQITPGAFILCTNLNSLEIIRDEILRHRKVEKKVMFNLIANGRGYVYDLKTFLAQNEKFKECLNKICIYCMNKDKYMKEKNENPNFIHIVTDDDTKVIEFIKDFSSKDIKPFPLTKLITLRDYLDKYKERHEKISEFYGNLTKETYEKNKNKIKEVIEDDEKNKLLKMRKEQIYKGLLKFNIEDDLKALDELIIKEYTKSTFYGDLNRWLMKGKMKYYEPVAYFTSRLMYSLNQYAKEAKDNKDAENKNKCCKYCKENNKVLYRGAKLYYSCILPYERAVGKIILLSAFTSTSEDELVALSWAGRLMENEIYNNSLKFSVAFRITNLYDEKNNWVSNCIDIQNTSENKIEKEFLYQPFSFYRVTSVNIDVKGRKADICLETIGKKEILEEQIKIGKKIKYNKNENIMEVE